MIGSFFLSSLHFNIHTKFSFGGMGRKRGRMDVCDSRIRELSVVLFARLRVAQNGTSRVSQSLIRFGTSCIFMRSLI